VQKVLLGMLLALIILGCVAYLYFRLGFAPITADNAMNGWEAASASMALAASIQRQAPRLQDPYSYSDSNLLDGMNTYISHCAGCHGSLDNQVSEIGVAFYPKAPQLVVYPLDSPEWKVFYVAKHGIRRTGMPAWGGILSDKSLWDVCAFLTHLKSLPPSVKTQMPAPIQ
jgi:mono/diheme cytochrome c family protein